MVRTRSGVSTPPNHGFGNPIITEGDNSLVVIDTTVAIEHTQVVVDRLKEMTDKPIGAVIYTHHHADRTNGAAVFISREDAASGKVKVIASENLMRETVLENLATGPLMGLRAGYM
ncbi:MAG: MBL fold metallo-hydrolase [Proteobacteria bacterium]|nr:MBL fold metallo-hydrolase [Pseudomonadota bacterium]